MKWVPVITLRLPYPVSANVYWASRYVKPARGKPGFIQHYVTPEGRQYRESVAWLMRSAGLRAPILGRVRIDLQLRPHCPKNWRTLVRNDPLRWDDDVRRIDLDNCRKVLYDALTGVAIEDDKMVFKDVGEVLEPKEGVEAHVALRIYRAILEHPQATLDLLEPEPMTPKVRQGIAALVADPDDPFS